MSSYLKMANYKNLTKKGAQGIGTLIIFIAMILVAAVAAGVLIQTASSLQSKSLDVGRQTQERLTTDIEVIQIYADDASDGNITSGVDTVTFVLRLGSGSTAIKLSDLLIRFDASEGSQSLVYNPALIGLTGNTTNYGVDYKILSSANHQAGYLSSGDLTEISFIYEVDNSDITEGETATLRLVSKNGAVKPVQITTPSAMTEKIVYLYP
jgi:flagellin FlaB